jgi:hypothetical protein
MEAGRELDAVVLGGGVVGKCESERGERVRRRQQSRLQALDSEAALPGSAFLGQRRGVVGERSLGPGAANTLGNHGGFTSDCGRWLHCTVSLTRGGPKSNENLGSWEVFCTRFSSAERGDRPQ